MALLAFCHFDKSKNQFQLIRHFILDTTLVSITIKKLYFCGLLKPGPVQVCRFKFKNIVL